MMPISKNNSLGNIENAVVKTVSEPQQSSNSLEISAVRNDPVTLGPVEKKESVNKASDTPFHKVVDPHHIHLAYKMLANTTRDHQKMNRRARELMHYPERRLVVNTSTLKQIIDYKKFLCHPDCSISRNQAIQGSDIDAGLVITNDPIPVETQLAFVQELRRQGFSVFTEKEADTVKKELEVIEFRTEDQLMSEYKEDGLLRTRIQIYLAGKKVGL